MNDEQSVQIFIIQNSHVHVDMLQGYQIGSKVGQIDTKWDKAGTFSIQITVHLAQRAKIYWNLTHKFGGSKFDIRERTIEMDVCQLFRLKFEYFLIFVSIMARIYATYLSLFWSFYILQWLILLLKNEEREVSQLTEVCTPGLHHWLTHLHTDSTFTNSC